MTFGEEGIILSIRCMTRNLASGCKMCYCDFSHIKGNYSPPTLSLYQFCGQDNLLSMDHLWRGMYHVLFGKAGVQYRPARLLGLMGPKCHIIIE